jgi:serine/threonine protein kinase
VVRLQDNKRFALKIFKPDVLDDDKFDLSFITKANNPYIIDFEEAFINKNNGKSELVIVTELGIESLKDYLERNPEPIEEGKLLQYIT